MSTSPPPLSTTGGEKNHWWFTNRKIAEKHVKDAGAAMASDTASALRLVEEALSLCPRLEPALELKARALILLRKYTDVIVFLQDYIPSLNNDGDDDSSSSSSSSSSSDQFKEHSKLLSSERREIRSRPFFNCFSVSDWKRKVMATLCNKNNSHAQGHWRYLVLGIACFHLGLMYDALLLLQTGTRLAISALRRQSTTWSADTFTIPDLPSIVMENHIVPNQVPIAPAKSELENIPLMINQIKLLLRRRNNALAALDSGRYTESIRQFSKILDSKQGGAQSFLAECYLHRALAYKSSNQIANAIADCNKALSLDSSLIEALITRASLFESICCFSDSLHDLEHLKLLYISILRNRKLPGPAWKRPSVDYREIPGRQCALANKVKVLKQKVSNGGESVNVDYYVLMGLKRGCSRSELNGAFVSLTLRHIPDRSICFLERCEFPDSISVNPIRERAKMSALMLYRLIQKGHSSLMATVLDEEAKEKQRKKNARVVLQVARKGQEIIHEKQIKVEAKKIETKIPAMTTPDLPVYQGVFCRDIAAVGNLLTQGGFNRPLQVKYEALSCS